jgi:hypothetical protein
MYGVYVLQIVLIITITLGIIRCCYISDKKQTIVLVGNGSSIMSSSIGELIDAHDIVVRFNNGSISDTHTTGMKTDLWILNKHLATTSKASVTNAMKHTKHLMVLPWSLADRKKYPHLSHVPIWNWPKHTDGFKSSHVEYPKKPTTGIHTLSYFLNKSWTIRPISLAGFDHTATHYFDGNKTPWHKHNMEHESIYVADLVRMGYINYLNSDISLPCVKNCSNNLS